MTPYVQKLLASASRPDITRERRRQLLMKVMRLEGTSPPTAWWFSFKLWLVEKLGGSFE